MGGGGPARARTWERRISLPAWVPELFGLLKSRAMNICISLKFDLPITIKEIFLAAIVERYFGWGHQDGENIERQVFLLVRLSDGRRAQQSGAARRSCGNGQPEDN